MTEDETRHQAIRSVMNDAQEFFSEDDNWRKFERESLAILIAAYVQAWFSPEA